MGTYPGNDPDIVPTPERHNPDGTLDPRDLFVRGKLDSGVGGVGYFGHLDHDMIRYGFENGNAMGGRPLPPTVALHDGRETASVKTKGPSYSITYEILTMSSEEDGEPDRVAGYYLPGGWHHEIPEGLCGPDFAKWCEEQGPFDIEVEVENDDLEGPGTFGYDEAIGRVMAAILLHEGATECSGWPHHVGAWWSTQPDQDFRTGAYETRSYHLDGFTPEQEVFIAKLVKARNAHADLP